MGKNQVEKVLTALKTIRAPLAQGEYDLHQIVADTLKQANLSYIHEAKLGPRCRIDFLIEGGLGIELKKGKPNKKQVAAQALRYAGSEGINQLIVVVERWVDLPNTLAGKPVHTLSLNRLWGIALT